MSFSTSIRCRCYVIKMLPIRQRKLVIYPRHFFSNLAKWGLEARTWWAEIISLTNQVSRWYTREREKKHPLGLQFLYRKWVRETRPILPGLHTAQSTVLNLSCGHGWTRDSWFWLTNMAFSKTPWSYCILNHRFVQFIMPLTRLESSCGLFQDFDLQGKVVWLSSLCSNFGRRCRSCIRTKTKCKRHRQRFFFLTNGPKCFNGILQEYQVVFSLSSKEQKKSWLRILKGISQYSWPSSVCALFLVISVTFQSFFHI